MASAFQHAVGDLPLHRHPEVAHGQAHLTFGQIGHRLRQRKEVWLGLRQQALIHVVEVRPPRQAVLPVRRTGGQPRPPSSHTADRSTPSGAVPRRLRAAPNTGRPIAVVQQPALIRGSGLPVAVTQPSLVRGEVPGSVVEADGQFRAASLFPGNCHVTSGSDWTGARKTKSSETSTLGPQCNLGSTTLATGCSRLHRDCALDRLIGQPCCRTWNSQSGRFVWSCRRIYGVRPAFSQA